jgi:cytoskeleton protein RodZ
MESVGELLRKERESQGKTIEDVARSTRVNHVIIEALEDDRFSVLPAAVYVRGHLRTYARCLGLDEEDIIQKYLRFTQQQEPDELDEWDAVEVELHEKQRNVTRHWALVAAAVVATVAILIVAFQAFRDGGDVEQQPVRQPVAVVEETREVAPPDTTVETAKLQLMVVARERTWLTVSVDGTPVSDLTLEDGERRLWEAEDRFELGVGTADAIELYLDGEFLGEAGVGRVVVEGLVITAEGMMH